MNRTELTHLVKTDLGNKSAPQTCDWRSCIVCSYFLMYAFVQDYLSGIFNPELTQMLTLSAIHYGHLASLNLYVLAVCLIPTGLLFDRRAAKPLMKMAGILITISAIIFWQADHYWMIVASKILCGVASSFAFIGGLRVINISCQPQAALATGVFFAIGNISGIIAAGPYIWLKESTHWRYSLLLNAGLGCSLIIVIHYFMSHLEAPVVSYQQNFFFKLKEVWCSMIDVATIPNNWLCGIYAAIFYFPDTLFAGLWGFIYLTGKYHFTEVQAGYVISFFIIGIATGSILVGWLTDKTKFTRPFMIVACLASMILMSLALYSPWYSLTLFMGIFMLLGILNCTEIMAFSSVQRHSAPGQISTSLAFVALIMNLLNAVIQPIFGWQVERYWKGTWLNGAPDYTIENLDHAMIIIPLSFFIAAILACFIKTTDPAVNTSC